VKAVDPSVRQQLECAELLGCEDVMKRVTIGDSANILARCASTTLAGSLRASI